jgi:hypothetical protein
MMRPEWIKRREGWNWRTRRRKRPPTADLTPMARASKGHLLSPPMRAALDAKGAEYARKSCAAERSTCGRLKRQYLRIGRRLIGGSCEAASASNARAQRGRVTNILLTA